ncbi:MATE family efflux transporter [Candidatus Dependentiae bacterium]|nr:MATE family efflux transporter [Candidatus Dependentiae bacterium]
MKGKINKILKNGDSITDILFYWLPEMISNTMLISLPPLIDSYIIASLRSTTTYGALGMANNFLHFLIKLAEAIPVAAIAIIGRHNGAQKYKKCGQDLGDTFWTTTIIGFILFLIIFFGATGIFNLIGVPTKMALKGAPFLRLRSIGILLTFISLSFFAFMRAVKNTRTPMFIYMVGMSVFIVFDYMLVLGKFGFASMGLTGSAVATIIQYIVMITISIFYILIKKDYKKYFSKLFINYFNIHRVKKLIGLSLPIMIDKGSLASAYVVLSKMIAPMGKYAIASYDVIKNLERFAILPAVGFAQIIIFLVSNRLGAKDPQGAKSNIKKVMILSAAMLIITLGFLCFKSEYLVSFFDPKNKFSHLAAPALVFISLLVVLDFVQLILAGALRGAGDVKTVMKVRFFSCFLFFMPLVYFFSKLPIQNQVLKFVLIYGSFYFNTGLMGIFFLKRIKTPKWQNKDI